MKITNSGTYPLQRSLSPPPDLLSSSSSSSSPPYNPTLMTTPPPPPPPSSSNQHPPHVMVSRINARLSSNIDGDNGAYSKNTFFKTSRLFAQDDETSTDDDSCSISTNQSFGHKSTSSSFSSSPSYNGRWCEEEKAIPLKKRRVVMVSNKEMMEEEMCSSENGKGWRCNKMRVKGHGYCNHHLGLERMRNEISRSNQGQGEGVSFFGGRANQISRIKKRIRRGVKARSVSSLLRDTVPLL